MTTYLVGHNLSAKTVDKGALARKNLLSIASQRVGIRPHTASLGPLKLIHSGSLTGVKIPRMVS